MHARHTSTPLRAFVTALALAAAIAGVYLPVRDHAFVEFDDPLYVRDNAVVQRGITGESIDWAFRSDQAFLWHPLTWLSLMLDTELHGADDAGPYALTNVALHVANALILLGLLTSLTRRLGPSAFAAALFALHPLRVEPVAWVSGRKEELAALFALLAIWAYVDWTRRRNLWRAAGALALYGLSLLAKPAHFALPFLLLLIDAWPLERFQRAIDAGGAAVRRLVLEKLPWLALASAAALASALMIVRTQNPWVEDPPLLLRILTAPISVVLYLEKTIWPTGLTIVYPQPHQMGRPFYGGLEIAAAWVVLGGVSLGALWLRRDHPAVLWGWAWFLLAIGPTLQIVPTGLRVPHDRYTYLPSIGLCVAVAFAGAALWRQSRRGRPILAAVAAALLTAFALASARQVGHWRDSETLFAHALTAQPRNVIVRFSRGVMYARGGEDDRAIGELRAALAIHPRHADSHNSLGYLLYRQGEVDGAIHHLREALSTHPGYVRAMTNLGNALEARGDGEEALGWFRRAVATDPDAPDSHYWLGLAFERRGARDAAIAEQRRVLALAPEHPWARRALARLEGDPGKTP
jgi:tetratricopeptide (TPR) repeat protein